MQWFIDNWYYVVFIILAILIVIYGCMTGKVKEWLKYAVCFAEKELGTGTGQLKLHKVYDMFVAQFPVFAKLLPFSMFSKWVDLALDWMKDQLEKNESIKAHITNENRG